MAEVDRDILIKRMRLLEEMRQMETPQPSIQGQGLPQAATNNPQAFASEPFAEPPGLPSVAETAITTPMVDPVGLATGAGAGAALAGGSGALMGGLAGAFTSDQGATGANLGEAVGIRAGLATGPAAPVAVPALAVLGGTTGFLIEELLTTGEAPSGKRLGGEALLTAAPEVLESGIKAARTPIRRAFQRGIAENKLKGLTGTKGGQVLRQAEQFRLLKGQGRQIFEAPSESAIKDAFDAVRQRGVEVEVQPIQLFMARLGAGRRRALKGEVAWMDAKLNQRLGTPGQKHFVPLFDTLDDLQSQAEQIAKRNSTGVVTQPIRHGKALDVGEAQNLRSLLRERIEGTSHPKTIDMLHDLKDTVDDTIDATLERSNVRHARDMYRRFKAAEEMESFFVKHSMLPTSRGNIRTLKLSSLRNGLDQAAAGRGDRATMDLYNSIQGVPGAEDRLNRALVELEPLAKQLELTIGGGDVAGLARDSRWAAMFRGLSEALLSDRGIELFLDTAKENKGRITSNTMALVLNATRRELAGMPPEDTP